MAKGGVERFHPPLFFFCVLIVAPGKYPKPPTQPLDRSSVSKYLALIAGHIPRHSLQNLSALHYVIRD